MPDDGSAFLVRCPRCSRRASVTPLDPSHVGLFDPRRLVCAHCGNVHDWAARKPGEVFIRHGQWCQRPDTASAVHRGGPYDWYFRLPLWLQTPCCHHILWAYNARHVQYLKQYTQANLREREPHVTRSLAMRLPAWMKSATHRDEVLKGIRRLEGVLLRS